MNEKSISFFRKVNDSVNTIMQYVQYPYNIWTFIMDVFLHKNANISISISYKLMLDIERERGLQIAIPY